MQAGFGLNVFDPDSFKSTDARIPELGTRRVVDESGVLTQEDIGALTSQIDAYEAASGGQMAVLLIRTLYDDAIEDFSLAVAEKWKIGWKGEDNGVLLLLAVEDHEDRLEIGYGLEGVINDARAGDILRGMEPFLRKEQYAQAISFAIANVSAFVLNVNVPEAPGEEDDLEDEEDFDETGDGISKPETAEDVFSKFIALLVFIEILGTILARSMIHPSVKRSVGLAFMVGLGVLILESLLAALKGGGGSGGSSGGGSSRSGGGGGGFGGGGASGKW